MPNPSRISKIELPNGSIYDIKDATITAGDNIIVSEDSEGNTVISSSSGSATASVSNHGICFLKCEPNGSTTGNTILPVEG